MRMALTGGERSFAWPCPKGEVARRKPTLRRQPGRFRCDPFPTLCPDALTTAFAAGGALLPATSAASRGRPLPTRCACSVSLIGDLGQAVADTCLRTLRSVVFDYA